MCVPLSLSVSTYINMHVYEIFSDLRHSVMLVDLKVHSHECDAREQRHQQHAHPLGGRGGR